MVTSLQVPYADVRAADLRWSDASAALPALEWLEVDVEGGGILRLTIVGCSHQVVADTPWVRLTETVARLPEGGIRSARRRGAGRSATPPTASGRRSTAMQRMPSRTSWRASRASTTPVRPSSGGSRAAPEP
jgi:hypothetical protein